MNGLQIAVHLNSKGVRLLESNRIESAIQVFQNGIHEIKQYAQDQSRVEIMDEEISSVNDKCSCTPISTGMKLEGLQHGFHYTYDRPLLLHVDTSCATSNDSESLYLVSVILIFNLALAYHSHAKSCGFTSSQQHAVKMYNLAAKMADSIVNDQYMGRVIMCFILNNLANLHCEMCDFGTCKYILKCIQDSVWNDTCVDVYAMGFIDENEWIEMKLNYIYSQIPSAAQAA
jgi:hypothetical protein